MRTWLFILVFCLPASALAESKTVTNLRFQPDRAISTSVNLDFRITLNKFIFFRVGTGAFPNTSAVVDTVGFQLQPSIPAGGVTPNDGNNIGVAWDGQAPSFSTQASNNVVPVDVRSNAGQVSIRASVVNALSNGTETIPMSNISVTSSDANLPAPPIPDSGSGAAVNVTATSFGDLVTNRQAEWTFNYGGSGNISSGTYNGQLLFTASTP
ncbi:MAG: hypothetical protein AB7S56_07485 [Halothiobacillaceae bacterium]